MSAFFRFMCRLKSTGETLPLYRSEDALLNLRTDTGMQPIPPQDVKAGDMLLLSIGAMPATVVVESAERHADAAGWASTRLLKCQFADGFQADLQTDKPVAVYNPTVKQAEYKNPEEVKAGAVVWHPAHGKYATVLAVA
jgi:hypothetical protein